GLDDAGRVIYSGTMSKILYPSLRLGFLVAPPQLVDTLVKVRAVMDQHSPAIDQATLARFITEGFFLSHVKRMRELYARRRVFFIEQFQKWLGDYFDLEVTPAGLHFVAWLRRKEDFPLFMRARQETGVWPRPLSFFCIKAQLNPTFVFGFAAWSQAQIEQGMAKLASAVRQLKQRGAGNGASFQIRSFSSATSSYCPACSAQAGLEALCSNSSPMLDRRTSPPVPRCVPDRRAAGSRTSLLSDAQARAPRAEALARI